MPNKDSNTDTAENSNKVDLNSLADLNFGPSWADANADASKKVTSSKSASSGRKNSFKDNDRKAKRDRRGNVSKSNFKNSEGRQFDSRDKQSYQFEPSFDVKIYPQDDTFDTLIKSLKNNCKTYQLFEITRVILEKPERFVILLSRIKNEDSSDKLIYSCPKDNLPFDTEDEAIEYFIDTYSDEFFTIEDVEVDPPSGNFSIVYRCPFTGKLIAPPNFHRFQEILKLHHKKTIKNLSLEDYQSKLESVNDEAVINEWVESMKKVKRYSLKESEDSSVVFDSREEVKRYLILNQKNAIVHASENIRFLGNNIEKLPKGLIKRNVNHAIEGQRRFPLETANNIRGRLRRHKFTIYKKGSKGVSYVCSVKRKFRDDKTVFTDNINALIEFFEKNQDISVMDLPYKFLNLQKLQSSEDKGSDKESEGNKESEGTDLASSEVSNALNIDGFSDDEKGQIKQLFRDLKWLISEGYVTEYSNGTLFVHQKIIENKKANSVDGVDANTNEKSKTEEDEELPSEAPLNEKTMPDIQVSDSDASKPDSNIAKEADLNEPRTEMIDADESVSQD